ncbi:penicillin-binding protein activator [Sphingomonas sp.]|uniref:penicillin-binding protein activator n=1 Tax=Sphingomonas sp. TaxID=28214 RepID=UPI002B757F7C|nr:penicillin-binding protein activator [Sphingomonas sp.]HWK34721.1 penicillin-binding protein activator [Sphingomonas sp.]
MQDAAATAQRRGALKRLIALAGAALLAGCSTIVPRTGPEAPPPPTKAPPSTAPATGTLPEDVERHRVALLVPLSGTNAAVGRSLANATQLALLDTQNERIRITSYDTATGAAAAATRAIAEGNQLILGPLLSEDVRAVAPIAKRSSVPVLSFSNDVSVAGNGAYVLGYTPVQSIDRVVDYARKSGITNFAGLIPRGLYGERASTAFLRAVEAAGGKVVTMQTYDRSAGSIAAAVAKMPKTSPFQAVLIADSSGTAAMAVPVLRRNGATTARVLGTELWNTDTAIGSQPALNGAWFASVSDNLYRQYATKYRARFGAAPYRLSSLGYDAVLLTVRIARDWRVGQRFPEAALSDRGGFAGLDGAFRFGRDGVAERSLEVQEVRNGGAVTVSPAPGGFAQ